MIHTKKMMNDSMREIPVKEQFRRRFRHTLQKVIGSYWSSFTLQKAIGSYWGSFTLQRQ